MRRMRYVTREWRKLQREEVHNLLAFNGNAYETLVGKRAGKRPIGTAGEGGRITKWILKKQDGGCRLDSSGSGQKLIANSCRQCNGTSGLYSFLDLLSFPERTLLYGVSEFP
jgi:hypothetical protein